MTEFDPDLFKETAREQWDSAAQAWHSWAPLLKAWLGPATQQMLDMAGVSAGSHVLDVAAGAGEQTITAAHRVGEKGRVLATDLSPGILEFAAQAVREAGLENVETRVMDGEHLDQLGEGLFDAVISRVALVYFPHQRRALEGMRHVLKPGGRKAAIVYSTAERNAFFSIPVQIIRRRAQLPPPAPGHPGPFSLGEPGALERLLREAGFRDVTVETVPAPVRLPSAAECVRFERESFGALHQMMAGLTPAEQEETWDEIESELGRFEGPDGFVGPCELVIGAGSR